MAAEQLNNLDRLAVRKNIVDRCSAIVANYALYILGNVSATEPQKAWAANAIRSPAGVGESVSWHVINQPDFLDKGSSISDQVLQGVVETAINAHFIASEAA